MFKKFAIAAMFATLASSSFAADNRSFYAGADIGTTKVDGFSDRGTSFGGFIGYQFHANFAVEAGYRRLGDFDQNLATTDGRGATVNLALDQAAVSVIGILPLQGGFRLFGRFGHNRVEGKFSGAFGGSESTSSAVYGAGLGYAMTPTISARLEVQQPGSDTTNVSAAIAFRF